MQVAAQQKQRCRWIGSSFLRLWRYGALVIQIYLGIVTKSRVAVLHAATLLLVVAIIIMPKKLHLHKDRQICPQS